MTARTGMTSLILQLRGMADAGTGDYTLGTAVYWDDNHVQEVLDRHRGDIWHEDLTPVLQYDAAGATSYHEYHSQFGNFEVTTGGTSIFFLQDSVGTNYGTAAYSVDYSRGIVTFTADNKGTPVYLTGRCYDLRNAAADIWRTKAGQTAKLYNFSTDGHSLSREQYFDHCIRMVEFWESRGGATVTEVLRGDEV